MSELELDTIPTNPIEMIASNDSDDSYIRLLEQKKQEAVRKLEKEKVWLIHSGDAETDLVKEKVEQIELAIECIQQKHEAALADFRRKKGGSIGGIDKEAAEVEKNIEDLRAQHTKTLQELSDKKKELRARLKSLENLDSVINDMAKRIQCSNVDFEKKMRQLQSLRDSMGEDEEMFDLEEEHKRDISNLEDQKKAFEDVYEDKYKKFKEQCVLDESSAESTSTISSGTSRLTLEDTIYLKSAIGQALTLGLAEILAKQPTDPIHYLSHWLLKYRYNYDAMELKRRELSELLEERQRIAEEIRRRKVEIEAYEAVLAILRQAEEEAERRAYELTLRLLQEQGEGEERVGDED